MRISRHTLLVPTVVLVLALLPALSQALPMRSGFDSNTLGPTDDGSTLSVAMDSLSLNFFGTTYTHCFVNNNGNITFGLALGAYTPFDLASTDKIIIAPFFADVDTRFAGLPTKYGSGTVDLRSAWGVSWRDVDYYGSSGTHAHRNYFQLVLIDRSDIGAGDFDIEYNYDQIEWESGTASGGVSAGVGYSNGTGIPGTFYEMPGSRVPGTFLDSGTWPLVTHSLNSGGVSGRYVFEVRSGTPGPVVPEPTSCALLALAVGGIGATLRRRRKK